MRTAALALPLLGLACAPRPAPRAPAPVVAAAEAPAPATAAPSPSPPRLPACPPGRAPAPALTLPPDDGAAPWRVAESRRDGDLEPPVRSACARLAAAASEPALDLIGRCHDAGRGAWVVAPMAPAQSRRATVDGEAQAWRERRVVVAYVAPDGSVARRAGGGLTLSSRADRGVALGVLGLHDLDGDGVDELVLETRREHVGEGSPNESVGEVLTVARGAVAPYPRAAGLASPAAVVDVDRDGRPDLVLPSRYHTPNGCGPGVFRGPDELAHGLADGSFSTDDAVAREWMRLACEPFDMTRLARGAGDDRDARFEYAQRAACLLYRGARNDDLAREAREELSSGASDCDSLGPVLEMVSVVAPFHLDAPCAAP